MTPSYSDKSAGIWLLHYLCHTLRRQGYGASLFLTSVPYTVNPEWDTPLAHVKGNAVIYPEGVTGNPLQAERVCRYLLYYPGLYTEPIQWGPTDLAYTFSRLYHPTAEVLHYPVVDLGRMKPDPWREGHQKAVDVWYKGKGVRYGPCPPPDSERPLVEITREYPNTKEALAFQLQAAGTLYSYDPHTALGLDAALCGCEVVLAGKDSPVGELGRFWRGTFGGPDPEAVEGLRRKVAWYQGVFPYRAMRLAQRLLGQS